MKYQNLDPDARYVVRMTGYGDAYLCMNGVRVQPILYGKEIGESHQFAAYCGHYSVPIVFFSGDEAACTEARESFPGVTTTPTKRGTGWTSCKLYDTSEVRRKIRQAAATSLADLSTCRPWRVFLPTEMRVEYAYSGLADEQAAAANVHRVDARTVAWQITDARDVYTWPRS